MRLAGIAVPILICLTAPFASCQPAKPPSDSRWNLLAEGGKGDFWTAPDCHDQHYFSGSPLLFDFEHNLYGRKPFDIRFTTQVIDIGTAAGYRVTQVVQHVHDVVSDSRFIAKRLLVQRSNHDFCAICQQLYDDSSITVKPASIILFDGKPVLKTLNPNGMHTWNEEYWTFDANGPVYLDLTAIRQQLQDAAPQGDDVLTYPFDLSGSCHKAVASKPGVCAACGTSDGNVAAKLTLRGSRLIASWVHWFPPGVQAACPGE